MLRERIKSVSVVLYGLIILLLGTILLFETQSVLDLFYTLNLILISGLSLVRILTGFLEKDPHKRKDGILNGTFVFLIWLILFNFPVVFEAAIPFIYGLWALLNAVVKYITWYNFRVDRVGNRVWVFIDASITFMFAMVLILDPLPGLLRLTYVAAAYLIFYGLLQILSGINLLLNDAIRDRFKIYLHFPLPMFIAMILPSRAYRNLHKPSAKDILFQDQVTSKQAQDELEIFIHLKEDRRESFGHVDISFRDFVFSYGLHDPLHRRINGTYGDGVLIQADRKKFIEYSIDGEKKTIVAFTLKLTEDQIVLMEKRVIELLSRTTPWYPRGVIDPECNDYASRIWRNTDAQFYKFSEGLFKTYFFVSTNCVLLVDYFVHFKGLELIRLNGLITPGSYFNFLNEAYQRKAPIVTRRIVYEKVKKNAMNRP